MNKAMLTVGVIALSATALLLINIISNYSTGSELDYYLLKETTEAAMYDAVDTVYYQENGLLRMDSEKFVESFLRRFADSIEINSRQYTIGFYELNETPPKVSVKVKSNTTLKYNNENIDFETSIDAILENDFEENQFVTNALGDKTQDLGYPVTQYGRKK